MTSKCDPERFVEAGAILQRLGRWIQRTHPIPHQYGAQSGEDAILMELLPEPNGTYVDVGAGSPVECSNTWHFYKKGWRGLLIEPLTEYYATICKHRPHDILWPQAVSDYTGYGRLRHARSLSSLNPDWNIDETCTSLCEVDTLSNILNQFPSIRDQCRLCSIDVEGLEKEVLAGIDWKTFHPDIFCVEWKIWGSSPPLDDNSEAWESILLQHGYKRVAHTAVNNIYERETNGRENNSSQGVPLTGGPVVDDSEPAQPLPAE